MIITLKGANFSTNNINDLLSNYSISYNGNGISGTPSLRSKDAEGDLTCTINIADGYTYESLSVSIGGVTMTKDTDYLVSGTGPVTVIIDGTKINGNVFISVVTSGGVVEPDEPDVPVDPTPDTGGAWDLNTLTLAHCGSAKLGEGDKQNLIYDQTTHELKVHSTGWYKVSYFEQPVTVGTEIEYVTNYGKTQTGNFVGIYEQADLVDGVAEAKSSFWPTPSKFGVYAPGQGGNDFIYIWDKKNSKTKTADGLEGDYFNGKTIKLKLLATGTEVYVDGVKLTWASGAAPATLTEGTNYYLGFHNSAGSGVPADTGVAQTITYIGPIR